jgi:hypothetical protein
MDFCKYKNMFGKPNEGVHSYRIFNIAIVDVLLTIILGFIISLLTNYKLIYVLILLFLLGIFMHRLFCVQTTIDKKLFNN